MSTELKNELSEQQSILGQIEKTYFTTDSVPSGYFESMEDRFFNILRQNEIPRSSKSVPFWQKAKVSYSIAAVSIFAIVGVAFFNLYKSNPINNLSQNEVVSFLEAEDEISSEFPLTTKVDLNQLTKEEVKKYLVENEGIDINNID